MFYIYGINSVVKAIEAKRCKKVFLLESFSNEKIKTFLKENKVNTFFLKKSEFNKLVKGNHQGIIALVDEYKTISLDSLLFNISTYKNPVLVMLDNLEDPHNLGAILRSADALNAKGIIYKKNNSVHLNDTVAKVSTGAINYVPCVEVVNLTNTIKELKKVGYWVIGLDGDAKCDLGEIPKNAPLVVVVGSEGKGISNLVKKNCDMLCKIPMSGHVECLNASCAAAIVLFYLNTRK